MPSASAPFTSRPMVQVDAVRVGRVVHVRISGALSEPLASKLAAAELSGLVVLDIGGVNRISSLGIRAWIDAVKLLPPGVEGMYVINAPPAMVDQYMMVKGFGGASHLLTILAPYSCDHCGDEVVRPIHLRASEEFISRGEPPSFLCASCRGSLRFSDSALDFAALHCLVPSIEPHPAVSHYLASVTAGAQRPGAPPVKLVSGDITFFGLRGAIGPQLNLRRLTDGLEGRVVYDFAAVSEFVEGGPPRLAQALRAAQSSARVFLWRVPAQVALALRSEGPGGWAHLQSLWLPFPCTRCGRNAPMRMDAAEYLLWLEDGTVAARPCLTCGAMVAPEHHPQLAALLRAHPPGALLATEVEPLEVSSLRQQLFRQDGGDDTSAWDKLREIHGIVQQLRDGAENSLVERLDRMASMIDQAGEAMRERERTQRLVFGASEVGKIAISAVDPQQLIDLALDVIVRVVEAERAVVYLKKEGGALEQFTSRGRGRAAPPPSDALSEAVAKDVATEGRSIHLRNVLSDDRYLGLAQNMFPGRSVMSAPFLSAQGTVLGVLYTESTPLNLMFEARGLAFIESVASYLATGLERADIEQRGHHERRMRERLSRYFSEAVVQEILRGDRAPEMGGTSRRVTVLFTDIRNSSSLLERLPPMETVALLNEYFTVLIEEILAEEGTIDKFTGDGLMALWNSPTEQGDHALRAARAALRIQARLPLLFAKWGTQRQAFAEGGSELVTGIGINTGDAVVGTIGSPKRMEYTAIGEAIHLCARIQGACQGSEILLSPSTAEELGQAAELEALVPVRMKGRNEPVTLYRLRQLIGDKESC